MSACPFVESRNILVQSQCHTLDRLDSCLTSDGLMCHFPIRYLGLLKARIQGCPSQQNEVNQSRCRGISIAEQVHSQPHSSQ